MVSQRKLFTASLAIAFVAACTEQEPDKEDRTTQSIETTADAGSAEACVHPICATGGALARSCDSCATKVCALDPYCCDYSWDATCVGEVSSICGQSCTAPPPSGNDAGASTCAHPVCALGAPLLSTCDSCATKLCAQDPYCCSIDWDLTCVGEAISICGLTCK